MCRERVSQAHISLISPSCVFAKSVTYQDTSLAWCELYVTFASIFRHFDVAIHDTSDADMEWVDAVLVV